MQRIINEPTAASLAYGMDKDHDQNILVFDLGGGTFDVSILEIGDGVFEVLATNGNNRLGGDDFDEKVMNHIVAQFKKDSGIDISADKMAMQRVKEAAEKAKIELSGVLQANINLPFITADATGPKHLDMTITRAKFDELTADLVEKTVGPTTKAMKDAGVTASDIARVILVGGSTRTPAVQAKVKSLTGKDPYKGINPDECVAVGAAIQAGRHRRRRKRHRASRCNASFSRNRDPWRSFHKAYRKKHNYTYKEEPGVLDCRRRTARA